MKITQEDTGEFFITLEDEDTYYGGYRDEDLFWSLGKMLFNGETKVYTDLYVDLKKNDNTTIREILFILNINEGTSRMNKYRLIEEANRLIDTSNITKVPVIKHYDFSEFYGTFPDLKMFDKMLKKDLEKLNEEIEYLSKEQLKKYEKEIKQEIKRLSK